VTDDQQEMNISFNEISFESRWLAMHRRRLFHAHWIQVFQLCWINGHCTSFLTHAFFIGMHWRVNPFQNFENSFETHNWMCKFYQDTVSSFQSALQRWFKGS